MFLSRAREGLVRAWCVAVFVLGAVFASNGGSGADDARGETVAVALKDGSRLVGAIVGEDEATLTLRTRSGIELRLARSDVDSVGPVSPAAPVVSKATPKSELSDPNDTRLMFAPSGRPLRKGDGYFSDHYVVFPGFAYGLTDNVSVSGGFSIVPGLNLKEQVFYLSSTAG